MTIDSKKWPTKPKTVWRPMNPVTAHPKRYNRPMMIITEAPRPATRAEIPRRLFAGYDTNARRSRQFDFC